MMRFTFTVILIFGCSIAFCQDSAVAKNLVKKLTSQHFFGRGYTKNGVNKAADFLAFKFQTAGLTSFGKSYLQPFVMPVNTFPGRMKVKINGKRLKPGRDYIVSPGAKGVKSAGVLTRTKNDYYSDEAGSIEMKLKSKLTWSVAQEVEPRALILLDSTRVKSKPSGYKVDIENKFIPEYPTANVAGFIAGTRRPDSLLVLTAHYDHLGGMGKKTYFPGANDNASGTAMVVELAKYFAKNPLPYSVAFICFSGEEAGLVGSKHFVENPVFELSKVRFLINLDMVGTGETGITAVNSASFVKEFKLLDSINNSKNYLSKINKRGKAANSDHYWFTEKGVPSFFIYTQGGTKAYHDINDRAKTLPLTEFEDLANLIKDFFRVLSR